MSMFQPLHINCSSATLSQNGAGGGMQMRYAKKSPNDAKDSFLFGGLSVDNATSVGKIFHRHHHQHPSTNNNNVDKMTDVSFEQLLVTGSDKLPSRAQSLTYSEVSEELIDHWKVLIKFKLINYEETIQAKRNIKFCCSHKFEYCLIYIMIMVRILSIKYFNLGFMAKIRL